MKEFRNHIPDLINNLKLICGRTETETDVYHIGLTVTYLTYLYDILEKQEVKTIKEPFVKTIDNEEFCRSFIRSLSDEQ